MYIYIYIYTHTHIYIYIYTYIYKYILCSSINYHYISTYRTGAKQTSSTLNYARTVNIDIRPSQCQVASLKSIHRVKHNACVWSEW